MRSFSKFQKHQITHFYCESYGDHMVVHPELHHCCFQDFCPNFPTNKSKNKKINKLLNKMQNILVKKIPSLKQQHCYPVLQLSYIDYDHIYLAV